MYVSESFLQDFCNSSTTLSVYSLNFKLYTYIIVFKSSKNKRKDIYAGRTQK